MPQIRSYYASLAAILLVSVSCSIMEDEVIDHTGSRLQRLLSELDSQNNQGLPVANPIEEEGGETATEESAPPELEGQGDNDHGDNFENATTITLDTTITGKIDSPEDVDYFKFTIIQGGVHDVQSAGSTDTYGHLYDENQQETHSDDDSGANKNFKISAILNSETYYVQVRPAGENSTDAYSLTVKSRNIPLDNRPCPTTTTPSGTSDSLYAYQWHLNNTGQSGGTPGEDINVETVWSSNKGEGVCIAIVDDGLELGHEDLADNVAPTNMHYDYIDGVPGYPSWDSHGISVAGVAAARGNNDLGVRGVAPAAGLVGYNLLQMPTLWNEMDSMVRNAVNLHVNNNSWGPADIGWYEDSSLLWKEAIRVGLEQGRSGKGVVYVWAGGNGRAWNDNSNYDGYANNYGIHSICAVDHKGVQTSYSEPGANLWVCAPSSGDGARIFTTAPSGMGSYEGLYAQGYTDNFGGTSSAAPAVSGVSALLLKANPALGYRDVGLILARTARKNDPSDAGWVENQGSDGYRYNVNHKYGFGVVDAQAAVALATDPSYTTLGDYGNLKIETHSSPASATIPDGAGSVSDTIVVSNSGIRHIEFVELEFATDHAKLGDLRVVLERSGGISDVLAESRDCCENSDVWVWTYGSARHLDEDPAGSWILTVSDEIAQNTGNFKSWKLILYGH